MRRGGSRPTWRSGRSCCVNSELNANFPSLRGIQRKMPGSSGTPRQGVPSPVQTASGRFAIVLTSSKPQHSPLGARESSIGSGEQECDISRALPESHNAPMSGDATQQYSICLWETKPNSKQQTKTKQKQTTNKYQKVPMNTILHKSLLK